MQHLVTNGKSFVRCATTHHTSKRQYTDYYNIVDFKSQDVCMDFVIHYDLSIVLFMKCLINVSPFMFHISITDAKITDNIIILQLINNAISIYKVRKDNKELLKSTLFHMKDGIIYDN